jgi:hypothetical protein
VPPSARRTPRSARLLFQLREKKIRLSRVLFTTYSMISLKFSFYVKFKSSACWIVAFRDCMLLFARACTY